MKIAHIDIQNFRKLKNCQISFSEEKIIFVGANNSGKTSAMDALISFLKKNKQQKISTQDFTISNWESLDQIANDWIELEDANELNLKKDAWWPHLPSLDVWLEIADNEVHYVSHIIPTLEWDGGSLGVRLVFEPENIEELYKGFKLTYESAKETLKDRKDKKLKLWPQSMRDFLDRELHKYFTINAYILDPNKLAKNDVQSLSEDAIPLTSDPFNGLFKIDIINAQRGFSDPHSDDGTKDDRRLSSQLKSYFEKHLNPSKMPKKDDLDALEAIETARTTFDEKLKERFSPSIGELEGLNYPGFSDPTIQISSKINPLEGLNHDAAVQFDVQKNGDTAFCLPEKYNGLGYQNLISMIFKLIRFRDEWMQVGKAAHQNKEEDKFIEPLHLVLIEEPEAHLHAQVQQVFIKKAYEVLRANNNLKKKSQFSTQLVISTHSSHVAHEADFVSLRYFKRKKVESNNEVPCSEVINLSEIFGAGDDTSKFAKRYLKTTHCDLFFADAVILLEGPAERLLVPFFITNDFEKLNRCYISLLEIGGSHAHRLKPLIESLGIITLVITDLDSIKAKTVGRGIARPERGKKYRTKNDTIKTWVPIKENLDEVLNATFEEKVKDETVRVAYQYEIPVTYTKKVESSIPYTFEDALVLSNIDTFRIKTDAGLIKKMADAVNLPTLGEACETMFKALSTNCKKAEMALELLYTSDPDELVTPLYIKEGLQWLEKKLIANSKDGDK